MTNGHATPPVVQSLIDAVRQDDSEAIETAVTAIIEDNMEETAVTAISTILLSPAENDNIRLQAASALTQLEHPSAVPHLGQALAHDADDGVRRLSLAALERLAPVAGAPYFQTALQDQDKDIGESALVALGNAVWQLVTALQTDPGANVQALRSALQQVTLDNLNKLLRLKTVSQAAIPSAAASAIHLIDNEQSVTTLCSYLKDAMREQARISSLNSEDSDQEQLLEQENLKERVMMSVVRALRDIGTPDVVECLGDALHPSNSLGVRRQAVSALGVLQHEGGIQYLANAFLLDAVTQVRDIAGDRLAGFDNWQRKTTQVLQILSEGSQQRSQINAPKIVTAVNPLPQQLDENPHLLTDFLIEQALIHIDNNRLVSLLAALIIASANDRMSIVAARISAYQTDNNITDQQLQPLRIEVGGVEALTPILKKLEKNLEEYFQKPILQLNQSTSAVWQQTIRIAQWGFALRALMSVTLFVIGAYLVIHSYLQFVSGSLNLEQFVGPGVSFIAGLGTMFSMVFTGPLKEIRKAVNDVGRSSAIFISYIHRILQVSHTFSFFYLKEEIDFDKLKEASDLMEDTMRDAIEALKNPDGE